MFLHLTPACDFQWRERQRAVSNFLCLCLMLIGRCGCEGRRLLWESGGRLVPFLPACLTSAVFPVGACSPSPLCFEEVGGVIEGEGLTVSFCLQPNVLPIFVYNK